MLRSAKNSLPLGVDIGATRVRIVEAQMTDEGPRVRAVAVRDISSGSATSGAIAEPEYVAALIDDAVGELGTQGRGCVCALGEPDAILRTVEFPRMSILERDRCARFEAERYVDYPLAEAVVRLHPMDEEGRLWALGVARKSALVTRFAAIKCAGLRLIAMDHEACAFARVLPLFDAVVDIGYQRSNLHVTGARAPVTLQTFNGGADVTRGIERELALDPITAEKRKQNLGTAGAGERARSALAADIASLVETARANRPIARIGMVGNGSRLPGLSTGIESATGALCEAAVGDALRGGAYPEDVVRSAAPDWSLAAGLALWRSG